MAAAMTAAMQVVSDTAEILRLRVLLAFLQLERESCTVMNMSRMLGEEHYAISRTINGLEKEGLVSRTSPRQPVLTEKGIEEAALTRFFMGVYALK